MDKLQLLEKKTMLDLNMPSDQERKYLQLLVDEGLQLIQAFKSIKDRETRAAIIRVTEQCAAIASASSASSPSP